MKFAIGDWVMTKKMLGEIDNDGSLLIYAVAGSQGQVVDMSPGCLPTVHWSDSGMVCDCASEDMRKVAQLPEFAVAASAERKTYRARVDSRFDGGL